MQKGKSDSIISSRADRLSVDLMQSLTVCTVPTSVLSVQFTLKRPQHAMASCKESSRELIAEVYKGVE